MWCILEQKCFRYGKIKFLQHIALVCICVCNGSNLSANNMIKRKQLKITKTAITTQIAEKWGKALTEITSRSNWSFKGCKNNLVQEVFASIITLMEAWFMFSIVIGVTKLGIRIKIFKLFVQLPIRLIHLLPIKTDSCLTFYLSRQTFDTLSK